MAVPPQARRRTRLLLAALLLAASATGLSAQSTGFRVQGVVTAPDDQPVAGAEVRLFRDGGSAGNARPILTDERGRWTFVTPATGRWEIEISAEGFVTSEGWVQVHGELTTPPVEVELRTLDEGTPAFLEGDRRTISRWLERANELLDQGRTRQAREEYQKALDAVPEAERPEILQAIARTHFLEQNHDEAVGALEAALAIAPGDPRLRQLYGILMEQLGRADEVERRLGEIAAARRDATPEPTPQRNFPAIERPLIEPAPTPGRTGHYRTRFTESSPLADMDVYLERFGYTAEEIRPYDNAMGRYDLAEESFDIVVPEDWDGEEPLGLFVFISPTPFGGFTKDEVAQVLSARRLIWVGADNVGNGRAAWYRVNLTLDAVHNVSQFYPIDPRRIYVAGYSGGGRLASAMTFVYPEVFTGGFFFYGTDWYEPVRVPYQPGATWPAKYPRPDKRRLEIAKRERRLVFLTGSRDFNRPQTKAAYRRAVEDGFAHATYLEIPEADHYYGIRGEWLERGLAALDAPLDDSD